MTLRTIKQRAGSYIRTDGRHEVSVQFFDHLRGWIAAAKWDRHLYTDPVETKRQAVQAADYMMNDFA